jgi:hypothetical protein
MRPPSTPRCQKCGQLHSLYGNCIPPPRKPLSWSRDGFMQIDLSDAKLARLEFQDMLRRMSEAARR